MKEEELFPKCELCGRYIFGSLDMENKVHSECKEILKIKTSEFRELIKHNLEELEGNMEYYIGEIDRWNKLNEELTEKNKTTV